MTRTCYSSKLHNVNALHLTGPEHGKQTALKNPLKAYLTPVKVTDSAWNIFLSHTEGELLSIPWSHATLPQGLALFGHPVMLFEKKSH